MLSDEILAENAEVIFNFKPNIAGIKNVLWQLAKAQEKDTLNDLSKDMKADDNTLTRKEFMTLPRNVRRFILAQQAAMLVMGEEKETIQSDERQRPISRERIAELLGVNFYELNEWLRSRKK